MERKILIVDVAALGWELLKTHGVTSLGELSFTPAAGVFPAVTCTVQATFRTALAPGRDVSEQSDAVSPCGTTFVPGAAGHGMTSNGYFSRTLRKPMFWEQSSALVSGSRIWDSFRAAGHTVGMLFWQQSLGENADILLSPAPIHKHSGGMVMDCYSRPSWDQAAGVAPAAPAPAGQELAYGSRPRRPKISKNLYARLCNTIGKKFPLHRYWGPFASAKVGDWIAAATAEVMKQPDLSPDLLLAYLPSLDYDLQRFGPNSTQAAAALSRTMDQLAMLKSAAATNNYDLLIFGDYAIGEVSGPAVFPNRILAEAGLFRTRNIRGRLYPDFHASRAFAMADHEIAHIIIPDPADIPAVAKLLSEADGVGDVADAAAQQSLGTAHPNSGELLITAAPGRWLAYPWWSSPKQAPDYATHIDIHNKPGYDPCELFFQFFPPGVSQDTSKIRGSHGRIGEGREVAFASTLAWPEPPKTLRELARAVMVMLEKENQR